jgi:hypothetical protein
MLHPSYSRTLASQAQIETRAQGKGSDTASFLEAIDQSFLSPTDVRWKEGISLQRLAIFTSND